MSLDMTESILFKHAIIIEEHNGKRDEVEVGATVTIQEEDYPPEEYLLVGAKEADPRNGKISNESPIGQAIIGSRVGDIATAKTPNGEIKFKILKIE